MFKVAEELLTPQLAAQLLEANRMNRKIREDRVNYLAAEMSEGRWHLNGDTLKIDKTGELADGQHRCLAVIKADFAYPAILIREIEPEARLTIDEPLRRRFSDDLTMNGHGPNVVVKEVLLRRILQWNNDHGLAMGQKNRVGRARLAEEYPRYAEAMDLALSVAFSHTKTPLGDSIGAFMAWLLLQNADRKTVDKFFSIMAIGSQDERDRPVVLLRDRIIALKSDRMLGWRGAGQAPIVVWLTIRGWNAWVTGKPTTYSLPKGRVLTNPYPLPARLVKGGK